MLPQGILVVLGVCFIRPISGFLSNTTDQVPPQLIPPIIAPPNLASLHCNGTRADINFVLDMSSSVGPQNFEIMKSFVKSIIQVLDIGPDKTKVGVITFSRIPYQEIHLDDHTNEKDLLSAIDKIPYQTGITETQSALNLLQREGYYGVHRYVPKIGIIVTDGQSFHPTETIDAARLVKSQGITMFAIGIGSKINALELNTIASTPAPLHVFQVSEFNNLLSVVNSVAEGTCSVKGPNNTVPVLPPVTTTVAPPNFGNGSSTSNSCNRSVADIMFVLDSSGSLGLYNFGILKRFVINVTHALDIGRNLTQVGVITFSNYPTLRIPLDKYDVKTNILNAVNAIPYYPGNTETDKALDLLRFGGFRGDRDYAPNVAIVITDGRSFNKNLTSTAAEAVKRAGTTVFAIGVGNDIDTVELDSISSDPDSFFRFFVQNFTSLEHILTTVINNTCEVPVQLKRTTTQPTTPTTSTTTTTTPTTTTPPTTTTTPTTTTEPTTTTTTTTTTPTTTSVIPTTPNNTCQQKVADIMFIVDSSGSIGLNNFDKVKQFVKQTITVFDVGTNLTRVGLMTFNQYPTLQFGLGKYNTSSDLDAAIDGIIYSQGGTNTGAALELLRTHGFTNARPGEPHIAIVITDGLSADPVATKQQAALVKQGDTTVIVIGIGSGTDYVELTNIASITAGNKSYVYQVGDYEALQTLNEKVAYVACGAAPSANNFTRFTPGPNLSPQTPQPDCHDTIPDCIKYSKAACSDYRPWATAHCSAFCGICISSVTTTPRPCVNTISNCHEYGDYICTSVSLTAWTSEHCSQYCGFCGNKPRPTEPPATPTPLMKTTANPGKCGNRIANCDEFGGPGMCQQETYKAWAKDHCFEYCGYCTTSRLVTSKPLSNNVTCPAWKLPVECSLVFYDNSCCPLPQCPPGYVLTAEAPHL